MKQKVDMVNNKSTAEKNDVLELMHSVMHQMRSLQMRGVHDGAQELAPMEGKALGFFARHPGATQSDLVTHSGRDKGQIARLIAGLKDKGLLLAQPDAQDGRVTRLHLSDRAHAMHLDVQRQRQQLSELAMAGISADHKRLLIALLHTMQGNLQQLP